MERTLSEVRLELATQYARLNDLNRITHDAPDARLGVVVAGAAYHDLLQALEDLGIGERVPLRILKVGMLFPLDDRVMRAFGVREADAHRRDADPPDVQHPQKLFEAGAARADEVLLAHAAVAEGERPGVGGVPAH